MDNGITRSVACLCALGAMSLFWIAGFFSVLPWQENRLLALDLNRYELQIILGSLFLGAAVTWGAVHLLSLADKSEHPKIYAATRFTLIAASLASLMHGVFSATQALLK